MSRRCPCFLHYHPPHKHWRFLTCACECDHEPDPDARSRDAVDGMETWE